MTKLQAIIREEHLLPVVERLMMIGIRGLSFSPVKGFDGSSDHEEVFRGSTYRVEFRSKLLLEWYGPDDDVDAIVRAIQRAAKTGNVGDGKIFTQPVDEAVRIRTGERGLDAV